MKVKRHHLFVSAILCLASVASGQNFTGSVGIQEDASQTGSYTGSALTLDTLNFTLPSSASGTFLSAVPGGTEITAYSSTISGLSSSPISLSVPDYLVIGVPGPAIFGSPGTTPNSRFDFDLQTLEEAQPGGFIGTGMLIDTQGVYANTAGELILNFSGVNNYSFTLQAVPEPATFTLVLAGFGVLPFLRRKN